ncbi:MAG: hypothetical protein HY791_14470 [Deltaproteobacteria bacterium]|nr:hypothetical protein [Deltaproteobacteria bacterium]
MDAIKRSGGLPRTALQLTYDAVTYARIRRDSEVPDAHDFAAAIVDQEESLRRLLLKGDTEELRRADKTDGRELEVQLRLRFLAHGLLIERSRSRLEIHPLLRRVLDDE